MHFPHNALVLDRCLQEGTVLLPSNDVEDIHLDSVLVQDMCQVADKEVMEWWLVAVDHLLHRC